MIAVDALDEVAPDSGAANPLFLPCILGKGVYFVLTTLRKEAGLRFDSSFHKIDRRDYQAETMALNSA